MIKRAFDIVMGILLAAVFILPMLLIALLVRFTSKGPAVHWSKRIGRNNLIFLMPKFRSMFIETPQVATHLLKNSDSHITPIGKFLRASSLDELPQLWSVFKGDMSLVGPRPALFNQVDLVALRTQCAVHLLRPGVTGWAHVNGRDEIPIAQKVDLDKQYLERQTLLFDLKILFLTVSKVLTSEGVKH